MVNPPITHIRNKVLTLSATDTRWSESDQDVDNPALLEMLHHYDSLRPGPDLMPSIDAFKPMKLASHLPHVALIVLNHQGRTGMAGHYYRVFGSALTRLMDMELTGMTMADAYEHFPERAERSYAMHCHVARRGQPMRIAGTQQGTDKNYLWIEALLLPFAEDGRTADHLVTELRF